MWFQATLTPLPPKTFSYLNFHQVVFWSSEACWLEECASVHLSMAIQKGLGSSFAGLQPSSCIIHQGSSWVSTSIPEWFLWDVIDLLFCFSALPLLFLAESDNRSKLHGLFLYFTDARGKKLVRTCTLGECPKLGDHVVISFQNEYLPLPSWNFLLAEFMFICVVCMTEILV